MGKETLSAELVLPIRRSYNIESFLIDKNDHVNNAMPHRLLKGERMKWMMQLAKIDGDILKRFGDNPFITHIEGAYSMQMFEKEDVVIVTDAKIAESGITFFQQFINREGKIASDFEFTASNDSQNGSVSKIPNSSDKNAQPQLYEFINEKVDVLPEWIDENGRLGIERYLLICENERTNYFKKEILGGKILKEIFGLIPVVAHITGDCTQQISSEDSLVIVTSAVKESKRACVFISSTCYEKRYQSSRIPS